jgi:hypothetical protein
MQRDTAVFDIINKELHRQTEALNLLPAKILSAHR